MKRMVPWMGGAAVPVLLAATISLAHMTPPVIFSSDRDAVVVLLTGARRFFIREVRLTEAQRREIQVKSGWRPEESFYRFYVGRTEQGDLVASAVFLTDFTLHGPVRVAVSVAPDGRVRGAVVVELTEETYSWVKPLLDANFLQDYSGQGGGGNFALSARARASGGSMTGHYGQVIAGLVRRAAVLYQATMKP